MTGPGASTGMRSEAAERAAISDPGRDMPFVADLNRRYVLSQGSLLGQLLAHRLPPPLESPAARFKQRLQTNPASTASNVPSLGVDPTT